jgi:hypothetical protein
LQGTEPEIQELRAPALVNDFLSLSKASESETEDVNEKWRVKMMKRKRNGWKWQSNPITLAKELDKFLHCNFPCDFLWGFVEFPFFSVICLLFLWSLHFYPPFVFFL